MDSRDMLVHQTDHPGSTLGLEERKSTQMQGMQYVMVEHFTSSLFLSHSSLMMQAIIDEVRV